jgi:prepilin-type N-terminal cleavage/methylation domain-containing protein
MQPTRHATRRLPRGTRRAFNLVEVMIAVAITAALLTSTMVALNASFVAYERTTEVASTHIVGRLSMDRMLTMLRTGQDFGPFPVSPVDRFVESNFIEFVTPGDDVLVIEWRPEDEALYIEIDGTAHLLLEGVTQRPDGDGGDVVAPFTLEYERGRHLYRATIDLVLVPDDNQSTALDADTVEILRLVGSAMPRNAAY